MMWKMVCRDKPGLPMSSVPRGVSADVPSPAAVTAREGRKVMPGTSGRCLRVYGGWCSHCKGRVRKSWVQRDGCASCQTHWWTQSKRGCCPRSQHPVRSNSNASVFSQQVLQTITRLHKLLSALQVGLALHPAPTHCLPELPVMLCPFPSHVTTLHGWTPHGQLAGCGIELLPKGTSAGLNLGSCFASRLW